MPGDSPRSPAISTGRSVDRLINFTDAVVAVAVTLLALPLVDISGPAHGQTVWAVMWDHGAQISTFLFTFYVVAIMWSAHIRILNEIRGYDGAIFWVNTTWLVAIVLLPWISAMYGEGERTQGGIGLLYWGTLALISFLGTMLGRHLQRHDDLLGRPDRDHVPVSRRSALRGMAFAGYFLAIGVVSLFLPMVASWMPLGIIPLSIWFRPARPAPAPLPMQGAPDGRAAHRTEEDT